MTIDTRSLDRLIVRGTTVSHCRRGSSAAGVVGCQVQVHLLEVEVDTRPVVIDYLGQVLEADATGTEVLVRQRIRVGSRIGVGGVEDLVQRTEI
ncbi:hypothetical protein ACFWF7_14710 [Nocardia sp. NPDC060256]|uniref:hypothetical protein n=1 Tax=Nocardia sp. NPDC060256 TaxID=3347086 RepID=UPI00365F01B3